MQAAVNKEAVRMRLTFPGAAFSVSTKTHNAPRQPVAPKKACARRTTSLAEICKLEQPWTVNTAECNSIGLVLVLIFVLIFVVRLLAPGPVESQVGVVFGLSYGAVAVTEQQLKSRVTKFVITAQVD